MLLRKDEVPLTCHLQDIATCTSFISHLLTYLVMNIVITAVTPDGQISITQDQFVSRLNPVEQHMFVDISAAVNLTSKKDN